MASPLTAGHCWPRPLRLAPYPNCHSGWQISSARNRKPNSDALDEYARTAFSKTVEATDGSRGQAYAAAALDGAAAELSTTSNGKRNQTLNAVAFRMGRLIAREWIDEKTVADALLGACDANKYLREHGHRATMKTIESGIEAGKKEPHPDLPDREPSDDGAPLSDLSGLSGSRGGKQQSNGEQQNGGPEGGNWHMGGAGLGAAR